MTNQIVINAINSVMENGQSRSPKLVIRSAQNHWTVYMPYRHKFSEKELTYLKRYGLEDFLDWQYSIYEESVWQAIRREVKRLLPKDIGIDDYELHDEYIYEMVSVADTPRDFVSRYLKRFKKLGIIR